MYNIANFTLEATGCLIIGNTATYDGGAVSVGEVSSSSWTKCIFRNNVASKGNGGSLSTVDTASSSFVHSHFKGNAAQYGGGLSAEGSSSIRVDSCVFQ